MKKMGFIALLFIAGLWACEYETIKPEVIELPDEEVMFAEQIAPIFVDAGCTPCHPPMAGLDLKVDKSYNSLIDNDMVDTANAAGSVILTKINAGHNGKIYTAEQKALILKWIEEGAKNN